MSIATEITRLQTAKANIKTSIENKGVTVPSNATLSNYSTYIDQITTGGGGGSDTSKLIDLIEGDLTSIDVPNGTTKISVNAFYGLRSLTSITIPNSVTSIDSMAFQSCTGLTSITIPDSVTSIGGYAFHGCTSLTSLTIGSGLTTIPNQCFYNCSSLTTMTIPNTVTAIQTEAFYNANSLTSLTIGSGVTSIGSSAFGNTTSAQRPNITITCLPTTPPTIESNTLPSSSKITAIYVPSASVAAYKAATNWSNYSSKIQPIA